MVKRKVSFWQKTKDWFADLADKAKFAVLGFRFLAERPWYIVIFVLSTLLMLYIFTFFRDGSSNWSLLWSGIGFDQKIALLGHGFAAIFENFTSLYGVAIVFMGILQGLCITALVYAIRHRQKDAAIDGVSRGGIASILGFVALGCPTCGMTLLTPLLTAIAGTGAVALGENLSRIFIIIAFILLIYTIIQLGYLVFITVSSAKQKEKKHATSD